MVISFFMDIEESCIVFLNFIYSYFNRKVLMSIGRLSKSCLMHFVFLFIYIFSEIDCFFKFKKKNGEIIRALIL